MPQSEVQGTQLLARVWQFREKARRSINSLLPHIQVMFLTRASLTVAALSLTPSSATVFFFRNTDNGYFYEVGCCSEHLPRKWQTTHFLLASSEAADWQRFWLPSRVQCPAVKMTVRRCRPSYCDTEPWGSRARKGGQIKRRPVCKLSLFLKPQTEGNHGSTIKWAFQVGSRVMFR